MNCSLKELGLIDAPPQPSYANLTLLDSKIIGSSFSLLTIVDFDGDRQYFKLATCVDAAIALQAALLTSERPSDEKRQFTYAISHDLKSPANTLHMLLKELGEERHKLSNQGKRFF